MKAPIALKSYKRNAAKGQKASGGASDSIKFNDNFLPFALYRHPQARPKSCAQVLVTKRVLADLSPEFKKSQQTTVC